MSRRQGYQCVRVRATSIQGQHDRACKFPTARTSALREGGRLGAGLVDTRAKYWPHKYFGDTVRLVIQYV